MADVLPVNTDPDEIETGAGALRFFRDSRAVAHTRPQQSEARREVDAPVPPRRRIAEISGWSENMVGEDELDFGTGEFQPFDPASVDDLLTRFDASVAAFQEAKGGADDATLMQPGTLRNGDHVILTLPCAAAIRGFVLNHVVRHRGQLSVFMRLQDVALPSVYGPTDDDQSF